MVKALPETQKEVLKAPGWVVNVGTSTEGLRPAGLEVYSDISYAPNADVSHGASVMW